MNNNPLRLGVALVCLAFSNIASAALVINFNEVGADVLATYSGSFASLPGDGWSGGPEGWGNYVVTSNPTIGLTGNTSGSGGWTVYQLTSNFPALGAGVVPLFASTYTGSSRLILDTNRLYLPDTYSLGSSIAGSATWSGQTLTSMQLTSGSYTGTLGNGETITVNIGVSGVPEPGQVAASLLLLAGVGGYVFVKRRKAAKMATPVPA